MKRFALTFFTLMILAFQFYPRAAKSATSPINGETRAFAIGASAFAKPEGEGFHNRAMPQSSLRQLSSTESAPPVLWNTFLSVNFDNIYASRRHSTVDMQGNFYIAGPSTASWGTPLSPYAGKNIYVAKINNQGVLQWNTFIGTTSAFLGIRSLVTDEAGNIYLTGYSGSSWGSPVHPLASNDAVVIKMNSDGALVWNTFLGSDAVDDALGIDVDGGGNIYISGYSYDTWGTPARAFASNGYKNSFVAKLNGNGFLQWNTFLGGISSDDTALSISVGQNGAVYAGGNSNGSWGTPVSPFVGSGMRGYLAQLDNNGNLQWNTFLGQARENKVNSVAPGPNGDIFASGTSSTTTWGTPIVAYGGGLEGFLARFDDAGALKWNTFIGCPDYDFISEIKTDSSGYIYGAGSSFASWGIPTTAYKGGLDAFAAKWNGDGGLVWNTFFADSAGDETVDSLGMDLHSNIYIVGDSSTTWGAPVNPWTNQYDIFFAELGRDFNYQVFLPLLQR